jgi:hypothetical protein
LGLAAATLLTASQVAAFGIRGSVIASGGLSSTPAGNASDQVVGTAGQPAAGIGQAEGTVLCSGFWCFAGSRVVAVDPPGSDLPRVFAFALVSSNPTRGLVQFELALPRAARMTFHVFDVSGRQIGDPLERRFEAGRHRLTWGTELRHSGVYFIRLTSDVGFEAKRTIVVLR